MLRITDIKLPIQHEEDALLQKIAKTLRITIEQVKSYKIAGQSVDARNKKDILYVYSVDVNVANEKRFLKIKNVKVAEPFTYIIKRFSQPRALQPVVVGSGPAGLFAALILAEYGLCPIIIERGKQVDKRDKDVYDLFNNGSFNPNSNVQFGEGGAGTYSDGKLTTGTHDIRIKKVIEELIKTGANEEIAYKQKPHIGTDKLVEIVANMRARIQSLGGEYRFENKLISINHENNVLQSLTIQNEKGEAYQLEAESVILAIGHSARDTVEMLRDKGVKLAQKTFSVGFRIEHAQEMISKSQYGESYNLLEPADYKLNIKLENGNTAYTFCMCPGGQVVCAASEEGHLVTNGMSFSQRELPNANSAVLVNVSGKDFGSDDVLAGIHFQRTIEKKAFEMGGSNYNAPIQLVGDYINNVTSTHLGEIYPSYKPNFVLANLNEIYPEEINNSLKKGILEMDKKLKGFATNDAILTGVETRSSSPVKIIRDDNYFSNIHGVIPCGEGAGYAGGIMSAAVDGIKCAEALCGYYKEA